MNEINLSKKAYSSLNHINLAYNIINSESDIFDFNYKGHHKVLKILKYDFDIIVDNKVYILNMLNKFREYLPDNFIIPDYLVKYNKEVVGFTIPFCNGITLKNILDSKDIDFKEKIYYLKLVGSYLEQLKYIRKNESLNNFCLNDLHECNILVNLQNKSLNFIDMDSVNIGTSKPFASHYLNFNSLAIKSLCYEISNFSESLFFSDLNPSSNTDLYCYIIMILNYLYNGDVNSMTLDNFYSFVNYLNSIGLSKELLDIIYKIVEPVPNENPFYYLESLTEEHIYKARKF